jgi:hypothetical protein
MEHILNINLMGNIHSIKVALPLIRSSKYSQVGQMCVLFQSQRVRWVKKLKTCSQLCISRGHVNHMELSVHKRAK